MRLPSKPSEAKRHTAVDLTATSIRRFRLKTVLLCLYIASFESTGCIGNGNGGCDVCGCEQRSDERR